MKHVCRSLEETGALSQMFLSSLKPGKKAVVVALFGDLGSGKTAFVKKCAEALGITENITSPTFVIEKIYKLPTKNIGYWKHLIHIDAYRFENQDEMKHLGFEEIANDSENLIFIEWPERILKKLPEDRKEIYLRFVDEESREIEIK